MTNQELVIEIFGIVQGVYLRGRIEHLANMMGLNGFVENMPDGGVKIIAQGSKNKLEELLLWCQKAPFPSKLTGMRYEWKEIEKEYSKFKVKKELSFLKDHAKSFFNLGKEVIKMQSGKSKLNVPLHVAIIPDGNRRWAREKGWQAWVGHRKAVEYQRIRNLFHSCKDIGVKYLTFWAFSTENWKRPDEEIEQIFTLIRRGSKDLRDDFIKEQIRFRHMGRRDRIPQDVLQILESLEEDTKHFTELNFQLCLDYNGRDEIIRAFEKMLKSAIKHVDEKTISEFLDSSGIPDPDLVIRTAGERRTSGIMAYQAAYAELYFTNLYFPDFDEQEFHRAILDYSARTRRFGGTSDADLQNVANQQLVDPEEDIQENKSFAY
jgi:undecaprenyl diphosphate synthase